MTLALRRARVHCRGLTAAVLPELAEVCHAFAEPSTIQDAVVRVGDILLVTAWVEDLNVAVAI